MNYYCLIIGKFYSDEKLKSEHRVGLGAEYYPKGPIGHKIGRFKGGSVEGFLNSAKRID
jgi:hypothetical protein